MVYDPNSGSGTWDFLQGLDQAKTPRISAAGFDIDTGKYYGPKEPNGYDPDTGRAIWSGQEQGFSGRTGNTLTQDTGAGGFSLPDGLRDAHPAAKVLWAVQNDLVPHLRGVPAIDEYGGIHPEYARVLANNDATLPTPTNNTETREDGFFDSPIKYAKDFIRGSGDLWENYKDMKKANTTRSDHYFHCKGHCQATQRGSGGRDASVLIGEGREYRDEYLKGSPREDCDADRAANKLGRDGAATGPCEEVCAPLRPPYLNKKY